MIDESLLNSLSTKEKEIFKKGLEDLINQTYIIENEYKNLNKSYENLQNFIKQIIEVQPNALWVLDNDNKIFLQNSEAKELEGLLDKILKNINQKEIFFEGSFFLIKIKKSDDKTIISATDITDQKRQERLISMGQVAAHLSHEIRNPIGSVSLLASTLFKRVDTKTKPLVLEIRKSIWRVERIIKATLLFTKGLSLNFSNFGLLALKDELQTAISFYTYSKEIEFEFDFPDTTIEGDFELLALMFQNFLFNAIDAIEDDESESGTVKITYKEDDSFHIFDVFDSGKEIEDKNILFEPFKTTKTKGNGLGLALSLQIIGAHKGSISIKENPKSFEIKISKALN